MKKENWEKEFDKRFEEPSGIIIGHKGVKDIKSFISQLLSLQKQEIVKEIEDKIVNLTVPECKPKENSEYHLGFNACRIDYAEEKLKFLDYLTQKLTK